MRRGGLENTANGEDGADAVSPAKDMTNADTSEEEGEDAADTWAPLVNDCAGGKENRAARVAGRPSGEGRLGRGARSLGRGGKSTSAARAGSPAGPASREGGTRRFGLSGAGRK